MKFSSARKKYTFSLQLIFSLLIVFLVACSEQISQKSESKQSRKSYKQTSQQISQKPESEESIENNERTLDAIIKEAEDNPTSSGPSDVSDSSFDKYTISLGMDNQMTIPGFPGELRVWIGNSNYRPIFPSSMVQDSTTIPALGESATVKPFAPAFKIDPAETQCIRIHPSGSEVRFKLTPYKSGTFDVGASVYLFDSIDCSGSPIPKTAASLKVTVEINQKEIILEKVKELWSIFWEKLLKFWAAFVTLIFGLFLFLIRGKLKQLFGFEDK